MSGQTAVQQDPAVVRAPARPAAAQGRSRRSPAMPLAVAGLLLATLFLTLFYGEARYRSCIQRVEAQFPAVPVSALNQRATGPLKVSFSDERARALTGCTRL